MYVAVLYTGSLRTIEKTLMHLKQNVLLTSQVHVYACLENDTSNPESYWTQWLSRELEGHIQSVQWSSNQRDPKWQVIKQMNLDNIHTDILWAKEYLGRSGSMFEHYQMQLAYKAMVHNEHQTCTNYEYVIRCRTDTIFCKPIDFRWLHWTDDALAELIQTLGKQLKTTTAMDLLPYVMYCMLHENILENVQNIIVSVLPNESYAKLGHHLLEDIRAYVHDLNAYIKNGKYILTFRNNLLYICKRDHFQAIPMLGTAYGLLKNPQSDDYWWNSESQFESICHHSNLSVFNYTTEYEGNSLYQFDRNLYFDEHNQVRNPSQVYCMVRY